MKHALLVVLIAFAPPTRAQEASPQETRVLTAVARCLLGGLPQDWHEAQVVVTLDEPGAPAGEARYLFSRQLTSAQTEPFVPCTSMNPARALADLRLLQEPERKGWKAARFVLHRDGKFDLTYDYPPKPQQ